MEGWGEGWEKWDHLEGQYSNLRKQQERSEQWYLKNGFTMTNISGLELTALSIDSLEEYKQYESKRNLHF